MVIILFFLALIGLGIYRWKAEDEDVGFGLMIAGSMGLLVCLIVLVGSYVDGQNNIVAYGQDKIKIEAAINNPNITGEERASAIDLATKDNILMGSTRRWYKNIMIGWFQPAAIAELPPFDISKIPGASTKIEIGK